MKRFLEDLPKEAIKLLAFYKKYDFISTVKIISSLRFFKIAYLVMLNFLLRVTWEILGCAIIFQR